MQRQRIVIIDDSPVNIQILIRVLAPDYHLIPFGSPAEALVFMRTNPQIDLIILDIDMPEYSGYEVFQQIKEIPALSDVATIFITARTDVESEISAFDLGIVDYIKKPIIPAIAQKRIDFHINYRNRQKLIIEESKMIKRVTEVTIKTLISLVDTFTTQSESHIDRIMEYVTILSEALAAKGLFTDTLTADYIENLRLSAPFHDCGKIYISDGILTKPDKLTPEEFVEIQRHTILGSEVMRRARSLMGAASFYDIAEKLVLHYHERWDGHGYPNGLRGEEIPLCARIMTFADVYDALTHERPYKEAYSHEKSVGIIMAERGAAFDPDICDVFYEVADDFHHISDSFT